MANMAQIISAPWYRREDYDAVRKMVDDPDNFPETFEEWLSLADQQFADFSAQGMTIEKVIINAQGLRAFCRNARVKPDNKARVAYAADLLQRQNPGHA